MNTRLKIPPGWIPVLLLATGFTLATLLAPRMARWNHSDRTGGLFQMLLGDGRRLLANEFFTVADMYFHRGYYPSIFDRRDEGTAVAAAGHGQGDTEEAERHEDFFGVPKDWVDRFGRKFRLTEHVHLEHGQEREILPWLRLAAELDPQKIETYTVGAYFLRTHLNEPRQAEAFLREGLRNNPGSYEILFELGRLDYDNYHDTILARNVWEFALRRWLRLPPEAQRDSKLAFEEITVNLARLEAGAGNYERAIQYLEGAKQVSPAPDALQQQIDELRRNVAAKPPAAPPVP